MNKKIKKYCFNFALILLFLPIAQSFFGFYQSEPLEGLLAKDNFPKFSYQSWINGNYQKDAERYIIDNFGFRNELLRIINSIDFKLFKFANSNKVVIGKDNHLFFDYNIERYLGIVKEDEHKIDSLMELTSQVNQKLKERNVEMIFVIAPSNAYYYSDKIPKQYKSFTKQKNDYDNYLERLKKHKINYIDFNKWFVDIKDTVSVNLFPKNGTHYSEFSSVWVADSLLKYMGKIKNINTPEIVYMDANFDSMKNTEHDLENLLNIAHKLENEKMIYYDLVFETENKTKPKVLTVGDSFYWNILNNMIPANCFANVSFWFYNEKVFPQSFTKDLTPDKVIMDTLFNDLDFIVFYSSSTLVYHYDYNSFLDRLNNYLDGNEKSHISSSFDERVNFYIDAINNNNNWYNSIKHKAQKNNVPIEEQILKDARWMAEQDGYTK